VKLIGISTDCWKNSGTGENYLTINIHYSKNQETVTYMLKTVIFEQSKTGDNTRNKIFSILSRLAKSPDFLTLFLIKIPLNSGADFKDFLLISPDFRNFEEF